MALTKEQKAKQIDSIKEKVANQKSMIFVDFSKVPSIDMFSLRKTLKENGCNLKIAKKTLVRIAFGQSNISFWNKIKPSIPGQLAVVFGIEDEIAPARIANTFAKTHENFKILGNFYSVYSDLFRIFRFSLFRRIPEYTGPEYFLPLPLVLSPFCLIPIVATWRVGVDTPRDPTEMK